MSEPIWSYVTPGIPDELFDRLPGIPMSKCETRLLIIGQLRLKADSVLWDIGAGTGTIPIETGLLCPQGKIVAIERDEDVAGLIDKNCQKFGVNNVEIKIGSAPECLTSLTTNPDRICIEGGRSVSEILEYCWERLQIDGRAIATTNSLEGLYAISESFAKLQARNVEVVQSSVNRLETRGNRQVFAAVSPMFIISGEKL
ncbi:precorrin-6Y C5,15-methyltransferase (decarboxylating) subunit CbiT [Pseudanabaena sp. SR411]|uniref:precorrin-6Y C5,15-methyltransferase subunit CbiT n=1 Tax=Pseudanabaena sp. SR411 TaxID=1980935 RepID=UPI000B990C43|nr:precorrin-6Y C5,15-methyltransferase subunit CbiT [Pseudanabaena sp. SR411]OYQ62968.1 precorrin-6Y C5,15-methyltransferase (decarboxylating) subunit CbiT [Pseudanabaena sp. SR411]